MEARTRRKECLHPWDKSQDKWKPRILYSADDSRQIFNKRHQKSSPQWKVKQVRVHSKYDPAVPQDKTDKNRPNESVGYSYTAMQWFLCQAVLQKQNNVFSSAHPSYQNNTDQLQNFRGAMKMLKGLVGPILLFPFSLSISWRCKKLQLKWAKVKTLMVMNNCPRDVQVCGTVSQEKCCDGSPII